MFDDGNISDRTIIKRREVVFILLSGFFLGTLAILNILGISRQIDLSFSLFGTKIPFIVFVGVLPYPVTFLCTDFISELYGRKRANLVVWTGLILNLWVIFIMWVGGSLPPHPATGPDGLPLLDDPQRTFFQIRQWTFGATAASMVAYLTAQFVDVHLFHFFKKMTKGKALWLRNNGSTLTSQFIDSLAVVSITWFFNKSAIYIEPGETVMHALLILIGSNYVFKMVSALLDTLPFYVGVKYLTRYLQIDNMSEYRKEEELAA
ncbi:MAG: queuosine precursor transporter [Bacteroidetes bacterium]|nr:queuosine precursor transporter [Bacteroidota bacterium]